MLSSSGESDRNVLMMVSVAGRADAMAWSRGSSSLATTAPFSRLTRSGPTPVASSTAKLMVLPSVVWAWPSLLLLVSGLGVR